MKKIVFIMVLAGLIALFSTISNAYTMNDSCVYEINNNGKIEVCNATSKGRIGVHTQYAWVTPNKTGYVNVTFKFDLKLSFGKLWKWQSGGWVDKTSYVEHLEYGGNHYYTWKNVYYTKGELELYAWRYKVPWNVSGKWSLFFWKGSYQNPNILLELDPWYNASYWNRIAFNISNPENIVHPHERIVINFTGVIGSQCPNNTITFGNESVSETEQMFGYVSNTTDSCEYIFTYDVAASQNGNVTAGYLYFNSTGTTNSVFERYGNFFILRDEFNDNSFNNTMWAKGSAPAQVVESGTTIDITGIGAWGSNFYTNTTNIDINMSLNYTVLTKIRGTNIAASNDIGVILTNLTGSEVGAYDASVFTGWYEDGTANKLRLWLHGVMVYATKVADTDYYYFLMRMNSTGVFYRAINTTEQQEYTTTDFTNSELSLRFINSGAVQIIDWAHIYNTTLLIYQNSSIAILSEGEAQSSPWNYSLDFSNDTQEFQYTLLNIYFIDFQSDTYTDVTINYNNTDYSTTQFNASTWRANVSAPFIMTNNTNVTFYFNYTRNGTRFYTSTADQSVFFGIYISNIGTSSISILEGDSFTDYINVTLVNSSSATRELIVTFNNTNTTLNFISSSSTLVQYSIDLTAPYISADNVTFTLNHTLAVSYGGNISYRQVATPLDVIVYKMILSNCSGGLATFPILNYTVFDEINDTRLINIDFYWTGIISTSTGSSRTYSFIFNNTDTATVCIYPPVIEAQLNATLEYDNNGGLEYAKRTHYMDNITVSNNTLRQIPIYLAPTSNVSNILLIVQDEFFKPLSDHIIRIYFWNYSLNKYVESHNVKTDVNGEALTPLIPFTKLYKFVILYHNNKIREFPAQFISSSTVSLPTASRIFNFPEAMFAIQHTCGYNNVTKIVLCTWSSSESRIDSFRLLVTEDKLIGALIYCDETSTSTSGTLSCDLTGITNSTQSFRWRFYVYRSDSPQPQQRYLLAGQNIYYGGRPIFVASGIGLIVMIPIVLVLVFIFQRSITLQLIAVVIALLAGSLMDFIVMTDSLLAGFIALVAIAIHKLRHK